jgi:hypothetical protein
MKRKFIEQKYIVRKYIEKSINEQKYIENISKYIKKEPNLT